MVIWSNNENLGRITTYPSTYIKTPVVYRADPTDGRPVRCFGSEAEAVVYLRDTP